MSKRNVALGVWLALLLGSGGSAWAQTVAPAVGETTEDTTPSLTAPSGEAPTGEEISEAAAPPTEQGFNIKLRDIEERVNELKEKIFQSKARLIQLQEVVLHGAISGAKAVLVHQNEMGSSFKLRRVQYALDGAPIFNRADSGAGELDEQNEIEVFNGSIAPGNHQISVFMEYQGYGYGFFSYLKGYKFKIKSSFTFNAEEGKLTTVRIVGFEKGGLTTELKDRPSVRYDFESTQALKDTTVAEEATKKAEGVDGE
ncbi:MAG: hypothetical protein A2289_07325 [Deltaproteobacteria bacterium RIFOXYA12_FULL_58_15]|nr:MAG: hypothetical protein A2289_07325 [Deltaproteobacteria bacterium RIFOXYA12_FULL_58_15]OGR11169.1 MAG: hypothetical protein A2341_27135 [Deltaproteobacteria bacterium RIFOXYB12_FULL_58_9]